MEKQSTEDFEILCNIGRGAFGRVKYARRKEDRAEVAIKIVEKSLLKQENKRHQAMRERNYLKQAKNHPGIVSLHTTFQDDQCLYFVMEYCPKGDLAQLIERCGENFPFSVARLYSAEITSILEHLRTHNIIHRDIKPGNLLITAENHLKLTDFGSALDLCGERGARSSFVGTADYVTPEVLSGQEASFAVDLWALGCVMYEMLVGRPPFKGATEHLTFEKIKCGELEFPDKVPPFAQQLIRSLLLPEPELRLGAADLSALKSDIFFQGVDFECIFNEEVPELSGISRSRTSGTHQILMSGVVKKKAGWIYKKRLLVVSDEPRISYYESSKGEYRGDIAISHDLRAEVKGKVEFHVITPKRVYFFKELTGDPAVWVEAVQELLKRTFYMCAPTH